MKPTFKSVARINKDAATKARRVIKEVRCVSFSVGYLLLHLYLPARSKSRSERDGSSAAREHY